MPIKFEFTGEASDLARTLREVVGGMNDVKTKTDAASFSLKEMLKQTAAFTGVGLGMAGIKEFASKMVDVRKEMQSFQTSFNVLVGNKDKASAMFDELKQFAVTTPLMLKDLAGGAQTMLGFNIEAEKVVPTLKAIGDISMGDSQKFQSLTLAFSQMSATGKLMGQDLLQMINAGFNPLAEISRKTGKSISELKDEMSNGAISAEMVADAFKSATSEGGQFFGMLEQQGQTLKGQINTLNGAIDDMFNTLAQQSEGIIVGTVQSLTELVKNYEKVGKVLVGMVATYGTYKAAIYTVVAIQKLEAVGAIASAGAQGAHAAALGAATVAARVLNATLLANPYVLCATLLMGFVSAVWASESAMSASERATHNYNKRIQERNDLLEESKRKTNEHIAVLQDEYASDLKKQEALNSLKAAYPGIFDKYDIESLKLEDIIEKKREIARLDNERAAAANKKTLDEIDAEIAKLQEKAKYMNGGLSAGDVKKLNDLRDQRKLAMKDYGTDVAEAFTSSLGDIDDAKIDYYIDVLKKKIKGKADDEKLEMKLPIDIEGRLSDNAVFSVSDIKNLIDVARTKKGSKDSGQAPTTASELMGKWKTAKSAYDRILKDKKATAEQIKAANDKLEKADKEYETATGTKASTIAKQTENEAKNSAKQALALADAERQHSKDRAKQAVELELEERQAILDAREDSAQKTREQLKLNFDKQKAEIEQWYQGLKDERVRQERELWEKQNPNGVWSEAQQRRAEQNAEFTADSIEAKTYNARLNANTAAYNRALKEQADAERQHMWQYLREYGDMEQQKYAIEQEYQQKIQKARADGDQFLVNLLEAQLADATEELQQRFGMAKKGIEGVFDNLERASSESVEKALTAYQQLLAAMTDGKLSGEETAQLTSLGFSPEFLGNVARGKVSIDELRKAIEKLKLEQEDSKTAIQKWSQAWKDAFDGNKDPEERMQALFGAMGKVQQSVDMITNTVANMADAFGNAGLATVMDDISNVMDTTMSMAQQGASIAGPWGAAAGAALGLASSMTQVFSQRHDQGLQDKIDYIGKSLKSLSREFDNLDDKVNQTFSKDRSRAYEDEISNLQQQITLLSRQATLEQQKKNADKDAIESYRDAIYDNQKRIKELREAAKDAIFGEDVMSAISSFAEAYADAWAQNTNRTKTAKDQVRDMIQQMVQESIKAAVQASGAMERIRQKMAEFYIDGVLTAEEQKAIYDEGEALQKELDARFGWASDLFDKNGSFSQNATSGGFATANQESVDQLNGRFAALQMGQEILISQGIQLVNGQDMTNSILNDILTSNAIRNDYMSDIVDYVDRMYKTLDQKLTAISDNTRNL